MNVTSFGKRDYDDFAALRLQKNKPNSKPNKANFLKIQLYHLSFLQKQESKLRDGPGWRIKCGMTRLKAHLIEYDLKKQSQFPWCLNECNHLFYKGL